MSGCGKTVLVAVPLSQFECQLLEALIGAVVGFQFSKPLFRCLLRFLNGRFEHRLNETEFDALQQFERFRIDE